MKKIVALVWCALTTLSLATAEAGPMYDLYTVDAQFSRLRLVNPATGMTSPAGPTSPLGPTSWDSVASIPGDSQYVFALNNRGGRETCCTAEQAAAMTDGYVVRGS